MAKRKGNPVRSEMGSKLPSAAGSTKVGSYPVVTRVSLGEKKAPKTSLT